jgi:membrane fusion protein (multidrug efflux system)
MCSSCNRKEAPPLAGPVEVTAMTVQTRTIPAVFEFVGFAQSSHLVEIRTRVEGYLEEIAFREGSLVHEGDLLFKIDPRPFEAALKQAQGQLEQQEAALWDAQRTTARLQPLFEKKAASRRDLDNAIAQEKGSKAAVDSAKAKVEEAVLNLAYTTITSPITGLSSRSNFRVGALVSPGTNSLLTTVSVINPIWVNFNVSESDLLKTRGERTKGLLRFPKNMNFDVELVLADGQTFPSIGKVNFTDPSLQQSTGSMVVRAIFSNPGDVLRPGQFVRAKVKGSVRPNAIVIPQRAVMQGTKGLFVYVIGKDNIIEARNVDVGDWYGDYWVINSGLMAQEKVAVDGINKIAPGMSVTITKQEEFVDPNKTASTSASNINIMNLTTRST